MAGRFEDHCWKDVVSPDILEIYSHYERETFVGAAPALLAIDLYELSYQGGARPVAEVAKTYPSSCGEHAWAAIPATQRLFAAARAAGLPIFYSTSDVRSGSQPSRINATKRRRVPLDPAVYEIKAEFQPQPGDVVITKQRASAFYGTPLLAHLTQLGVQASMSCWSRNAASTATCCRTRSISSTCTTNTPT